MLKFREVTGTRPQLSAKPEGVPRSTATPDPLLTMGSKGLCSSQYQQPILFSPNLSQEKVMTYTFSIFIINLFPMPAFCLLLSLQQNHRFPLSLHIYVRVTIDKKADASQNFWLSPTLRTVSGYSFNFSFFVGSLKVQGLICSCILLGNDYCLNEVWDTLHSFKAEENTFWVAGQTPLITK